MKIKYVLPVIPGILMLAFWVRLSGLSRSPREAFGRASVNWTFPGDFVNRQFLEHLDAKGFSPRSRGLLYSVDDGVKEIDSAQEGPLVRRIEKDNPSVFKFLCCDCPVYFKLQSKFGFYWIDVIQ
ncbi:MAG TPA: hypothetical protein PKY05_13050 [Fibrobacteria bacterium]|nr:hypothetical protein [Fibrobacteria bacterium]